MRYEYQESATGGHFLMSLGQADFSRFSFQEQDKKYNAIIWNRGKAQYIKIDDWQFQIPENTFIALNVSHSFRLERSEDAVIWQFNREFYCIITHDAEVSCSGLLFYGWRETDPIYLNERKTRSFAALTEVFQDEFETRDNIQGEMLRVLLKRLIIKLTRLIKEQTPIGQLKNPDLDTIRQFNMLVENNYKKIHQVQDYANLMFKSPKTLSNLFAKYNDKSPLQIIAQRIFLESKRLMLYTDLSASEIGYELGFTEPAHFSRFFKKMAGQTPSDFKKSAIGVV